MYHLHLTLFTLVAARVSDYSVIFGDRRGSIRGLIEIPSSRPYNTESYKISLARYLYLYLI